MSISIFDVNENLTLFQGSSNSALDREDNQSRHTANVCITLRILSNMQHQIIDEQS